VVRFVFILFIIFSALLVKAMQIDSLYAILPNLEGKAKVDVFNQLAEKDTENSSQLAGKALSLAEELSYPKGIAGASEILGSIAFDSLEYETAIDYYKKSNAAFTLIEDTEGQLRTLKNLHHVSFDLKLYDEAIDYCLQLQHLSEKLDNKSYLAYSYTRLGRLRGEIMKDQKGSREYSFKAIDLYFEINEKELLSNLYTNIGISYYLDQQYDSSMIYLNKGIVWGKEFGQNKQLHSLYSMLSELYYQKKNYDKALECSKQALSLSFDNGRERLVAFDNLLVGKIFIAKEQYDTALHFVNIGIESAKAIEKDDYIITGYEHLSKIYKGKNDLLKSIEYLEIASQLKDTIVKNSFSLALAEKEAEFQMQIKRQELQSLEKSAYQQRLFRNGLIVISILIIFILGLFINRYNVIMKFQKQELDRLRTIKQLEEKEKLFLKDKLLHKEKILASNTMHIIQKNQILTDLKTEITNLPIAKNGDSLKSKIKSINRTIETNMTFEDDWQNFKLQFEQVHPKFFSKLDKLYPNLGNNETRFCAYIKMGHNTKEIAQLMGINAESVQKARYRLKKKMELDKSLNLIEYIQKI